MGIPAGGVGIGVGTMVGTEVEMVAGMGVEIMEVTNGGTKEGRETGPVLATAKNDSQLPS